MDKEPEFDSDGYPTEATLETISKWELKSNQDIAELIEYVKKAWRYGFDFTRQEIGDWKATKLLTIATGGWSGNEDIIQALEQNWIFWGVCWRVSMHAGLYQFELEPLKTYAS